MDAINVFFDLLSELDYQVDRIDIFVGVQKYILKLYLKDLEYIKTVFYERVKIKNIVHVSSEIGLVLPTINFDDKVIHVQIDIKDYSSITYPPNTTIIDVSHQYSYQNEKPFPTNNLPRNLKCFSIETNIPMELTNLPNQLKSMYLIGCEQNLDFVPVDLEFLELSRFHYELPVYNETKHFENLPSSLKQIRIGSYIYNSVSDLLNNYWKNLNPYVLFFDTLSNFEDLNIDYIHITIKENDFYYIVMNFFHSYDFDNFDDTLNQQLDSVNYPNPFKFSDNCRSLSINFLISKDDYILITFPPNIKKFIFYHSGLKKSIPLNNLPNNLEILEIYSYTSYELGNLPNNLTELILIGLKHNLDLLPPNLKFLEVSQYDKIYGQLLYQLDSFVNLPSSLKEIIIGEYSYKSVSDLLENYEKNVEKYYY